MAKDFPWKTSKKDQKMIDKINEIDDIVLKQPLDKRRYSESDPDIISYRGTASRLADKKSQRKLLEKALASFIDGGGVIKRFNKAEDSYFEYNDLQKKKYRERFEKKSKP